MNPLGKKSGLILLLVGWAGCADTTTPAPGEIVRFHQDTVEGRSGYDVVIREAQDLPETQIREVVEPDSSTVYEVKDLRTEELDQYIGSKFNINQKANSPEATGGESLHLRRQRNLLRRYRNLALYNTQK